MSEVAGGLRSELRVVRTVRRAGFVGRGAEGATAGGGGGDPSSLGAGALALAVSAVENPVFAAPLAALVLIGAIEQYAQPHLGPYGLGGIILPDNVFRPWEYADKVRRLTLEKVYGAQEGDKVWNAEWNQRAIDIDLRTRMP